MQDNTGRTDVGTGAPTPNYGFNGADGVCTTVGYTAGQKFYLYSPELDHPYLAARRLLRLHVGLWLRRRSRGVRARCRRRLVVWSDAAPGPDADRRAG